MEDKSFFSPECSVSVTFIIAGAARSGTTALYEWLGQHPEIYTSPLKETNFFVHDLIQREGPGDAFAIPDITEQDVTQLRSGKNFRISGLVSSPKVYCKLFEPGMRAKARGEASVSYLYFAPYSAPRIRSALPNAKIIIILRDPVERAWSAYRYLLGRENLPPEQAFQACYERRSRRWETFWDYLGYGLYASQVETFLNHFPRNNVGIWLYEDLVQEPHRVYREILRLINVDDTFVPSFKKINISKKGYNKLWRIYWRYFPWLGQHIPRALKESLKILINRTTRKELHMSPEVREWLLNFYQEDIYRLDRMLPELGVTRWVENQKAKIEAGL